VLNANLRVALNSAAWSGFVSYFLGVTCMALLALALRDPIPSVAVAERVSWWAYSGGLFGAIFIGLAIFLVPQLGLPPSSFCLSLDRCSRRRCSTNSGGWASLNARLTYPA
jgi:uncharacterized membrane protein YdcZ (DUF606 family)